MLYIGIDLGTSAVKLLLMDADGKIKKIAHPPYQSKISETSESSIYPILIGIGCFSFFIKKRGVHDANSLFSAQHDCWKS